MDCCCSVEKEKDFLLRIVEGLQKLVVFVPGTHYGGTFYASKIYDDKAEQAQVARLNLEGTVALLYVLAYKEGWPKCPTPEQQKRIDEIYEMLEKESRNNTNELCEPRHC